MLTLHSWHRGMHRLMQVSTVSPVQHLPFLQCCLHWGRGAWLQAAIGPDEAVGQDSQSRGTLQILLLDAIA